ncbi:MAG TPA: phosphoglycerate mutase family protein [Candidatus Saccharimonadales bacterium]
MQDMAETLQLLVLVRHGKTARDELREAWKRGENPTLPPGQTGEDLLDDSIKQMWQSGRWIAQHILRRFGLQQFDGYFTSLSQRSIESAAAMDFTDVVWQGDERLNERDRGEMRKLLPKGYASKYPESIEAMQRDPLHWVPVGGEAVLPHVMDKTKSILREIGYGDTRLRSSLVVGHRDQIWSFAMPLERLSEDEFLAVDTESMGNGHVICYSSYKPQSNGPEYSPSSGAFIPGPDTVAPALLWKLSVDPQDPAASAGWQILPHVAEHYGWHE